MKKIAVVTGTRAEYGILSSVLKAIKAHSKLALSLIVTGMHLSHEFGYTVKEIENDGLKIEAMRKVCKIKKSGETEVWGRYFTETGLFDVIDIDIPQEYIRPDYRLTLDYPEDFDFLKKIFEHFGENTYKASTLDIIKFLDENPQVVEINKHCQELYKERWESQNKLARWKL